MKPWEKLYPLTDQNAFICLVRSMGDDSAIVQAARVSYGKDEQDEESKQTTYCPICKGDWFMMNGCENPKCEAGEVPVLSSKDRNLIRYLLRHSHTTPFEMVEFKFMVQVPMDCWRQWVRHRTANINEYSTRYTEALDFFQTTSPQEWRLQATDNKQGSGGFLEEWPEGFTINHISKNKWSVSWIEDEEEMSLGVLSDSPPTPGDFLSQWEKAQHKEERQWYDLRLRFGVAKEQARKDLPLSTYTRAYWKCDLHNIFNFLRLRMDSHAQLEIRQFANCMFEIVKSICPVACEAFEDYVLNAKKFSRMEMEELRKHVGPTRDDIHIASAHEDSRGVILSGKPSSMTDREWKEFLGKLS